MHNLYNIIDTARNNNCEWILKFYINPTNIKEQVHNFKICQLKNETEDILKRNGYLLEFNTINDYSNNIKYVVVDKNTVRVIYDILARARQEKTKKKLQDVGVE